MKRSLTLALLAGAILALPATADALVAHWYVDPTHAFRGYGCGDVSTVTVPLERPIVRSLPGGRYGIHVRRPRGRGFVGDVRASVRRPLSNARARAVPDE